MSSLPVRMVRSWILVVLCVCSLLLAFAPAASAKPMARLSVVGGSQASGLGFVAAILEDGRLICSGSVVSSTTVVTAAHCISAGSARLSVVTGQSVLGAGGGQVIGVSGITVHPGYSGGTPDIAVIKLVAPTSAPPVQLATLAEEAAFTQPGQVVVVAGFGVRNPWRNRKPGVGILLSTAMYVSNFCFVVPSLAPETETCVQGPRQSRYLRNSCCSGDSGGPMVGLTSSGPRLLGVLRGEVMPKWVRRYLRCAYRKSGSMYGRTAVAREFIQPYL